MEEEAVIISLFRGHLSFCLRCFNVYEEGGDRSCSICRKWLFAFSGFIIEKIKFFFFMCVLQKKINTLQKKIQF